MSVAIFRIKKLKESELHGSSSHVARTRPTRNADPSRKALNVELIGSAPSPVESIKQRVNAVKKARQDQGVKKLRKDGVRAVEVIMTAPADYWEDRTKDFVSEWAKHSLAFLKKEFGSENIVSATLHQDEIAPHIHAYHVPVARDGKGVATLAAARYYNGKKMLSELQSRYAEHMQTFDPGLKRGLKASRVSYKSVADFYSRLKIPVPEAPVILPEFDVGVPPRALKKDSRVDWARRESKRLKKLVEKHVSQQFEELGRQMALTKHFKAEYETERVRTEAYRKLASDPSEIENWRQFYLRWSDSVRKIVAELDSTRKENQRLLNMVETEKAAGKEAHESLEAIIEAAGVEDIDLLLEIIDAGRQEVVRGSMPSFDL